MPVHWWPGGDGRAPVLEIRRSSVQGRWADERGSATGKKTGGSGGGRGGQDLAAKANTGAVALDGAKGVGAVSTGHKCGLQGRAR